MLRRLRRAVSCGDVAARSRDQRTYLCGGPAYWIVNLAALNIEVYRLAQRGGYELVAVAVADETVDVLLGGELVGSLRVCEVLP